MHTSILKKSNKVRPRFYFIFLTLEIYLRPNVNCNYGMEMMNLHMSFFPSYEEAWASGIMRRMKDKNEYVFLKTNFHFICAKTHKHVPLNITWQEHDIAKVVHNFDPFHKKHLKLWWWVMTIMRISFKPFFKCEKAITF
jgi:hypothetical protein